jgi:hypothetical protein
MALKYRGDGSGPSHGSDALDQAGQIRAEHDKDARQQQEADDNPNQSLQHFA